MKVSTRIGAGDSARRLGARAERAAAVNLFRGCSSPCSSPSPLLLGFSVFLLFPGCSSSCPAACSPSRVAGGQRQTRWQSHRTLTSSSCFRELEGLPQRPPSAICCLIRSSAARSSSGARTIRWTTPLPAAMPVPLTTGKATGTTARRGCGTTTPNPRSTESVGSSGTPTRGRTCRCCRASRAHGTAGSSGCRALWPPLPRARAAGR